MPRIIQDKKVFTLLEVTNSIKKTLQERYSSAFWLSAEMSKLNYYAYSGHCYPVLLQKEGGKIVAEIRSIIWKDDFLRINSTFQKVLNEPLKDGINILISAKIIYDPLYGLSLRIIDIDPSYSLGELEREKQWTIQKLRVNSLFDLNKKTNLALLPKRIAIISVKTGDGYSDFIKKLSQNPFRYQYFTMLFPALLQGDRAVDSIIAQLNKIIKVKHHFDAVAIIRGGGGDLSLSCYNNYDLSESIAKFPIPVVTGIGHSTNQTVVEMVSYQSFITPTDAANFFVQKFHDFAVPLQLAQKALIEDSKLILLNEKKQLIKEVKNVQSVSKFLLLKIKSKLSEAIINFKNECRSATKDFKRDLNDAIDNLNFSFKSFAKAEKDTLSSTVRTLKKDSIFLIKNYSKDLSTKQFAFTKLIQNFINKEAINLEKSTVLMSLNAKHFLKSNEENLRIIEKKLDLLNPENLFKRGYSITLYQKMPIKGVGDLTIGGELTTITSDGKITSRIEKIENHIK